MTSKTLIKTIPIDKVVNPWVGDQQIQFELLVSKKYKTDNPPSFVCKKCEITYKPHPHQTIYYELCNSCFKKFDNQKIKGRKAALIDKDKKINYFEDVNAWVKS